MNIVRYFLNEGESRLQEEELDRAIKNKNFIEEQTRKTVDAFLRVDKKNAKWISGYLQEILIQT